MFSFLDSSPENNNHDMMVTQSRGMQYARASFFSVERKRERYFANSNFLLVRDEQPVLTLPENLGTVMIRTEGILIAIENLSCSSLGIDCDE